MKARWPTTALLIGAAAVRTSPVGALDFSATVAVEGTAFPSEGQLTEQSRHDVSGSFSADFYHEWKTGASGAFVPFARLGGVDSRRSHFDVRELNYFWLGDGWELRAGVGKVFWGATEFVHLVDVINQTDLVEHVDAEDKLGQPMVHLSIPRRWGVVDFFVLPYFRERTYPGQEGRLRSSIAVDTDKARYESEDEERHLDFAVRYGGSVGDWDWGVHHYYGTGREPTLLPGSDGNGEPELIPFYELIHQTGTDLRGVLGGWLYKLEALYRAGQGDAFLAAVGGFEYSFVRVADTSMDLGVIAEWAYDERGGGATTPFQNDVMLGLRLAVNDPAGTELLIGILQDAVSPARIVQLEGSRRLGSNWRATVEARAFVKTRRGDPLYASRDDDFLRLDVAYYY
jgi:hypothetical protein